MEADRSLGISGMYVWRLTGVTEFQIWQLYHSDPKFSDRYAWPNGADPDQTAPRGAV